MCLAVPGRVLDLDEEHGIRFGRVDFGGIARRVCLDHVRDAVPGDYVLVHVGYALTRIDATEASALLALLDELAQAAEDA